MGGASWLAAFAGGGTGGGSSAGVRTFSSIPEGVRLTGRAGTSSRGRIIVNVCGRSAGARLVLGVPKLAGGVVIGDDIDMPDCVGLLSGCMGGMLTPLLSGEEETGALPVGDCTGAHAEPERGGRSIPDTLDGRIGAPWGIGVAG